MTSFSMFLFAPAAVHGAACSSTYATATSTWQTIAQNSACYCGNPPDDSANNCGSATGNTCIDEVDGGKTCKLMAKCATTDGSAAADYCECINTAATLDAAGGDAVCGPEGYCYTDDLAAVATGNTKCSNRMSTKLATTPTFAVSSPATQGAFAYVAGMMSKCGDKYCEAGDYCGAVTSAGVGTCQVKTNRAVGLSGGSGTGSVAGDTERMICANIVGGASCGGSGINNLFCTAITISAGSGATGTPNNWDVITSTNTDRCMVGKNFATDAVMQDASSKRYFMYGTPVVTSSALAVATGTVCTAYKVLAPNEYCYAAGTGGTTTNDNDATIYCAGGSYFLGTTISTAVDLSGNAAAKKTAIQTYCKAAGTTASGEILTPKLCNVHAQTTAGEGCACAPNAGDLNEVQGGERACPDNSYCYAQGKDKGQTLQGVNTCMSAEAKQCYENAGSASSDSSLTSANMNGTVFTAAHGSTTGHGEACFCGDKICGAGRACISANTTGWSGIAADGACGAATYAASHQCLSAAIDHCPGANGTVGLDVFSAGRADPWKITADGVNKACYCDAGETTICGAGRYCLNNTASGFTGSAECLSDVLQHCTNYTGFTSADEACTCSDSLTCAQGQFCVNGTHFTDDSKPAECLAAQIAPCVNWTTALGANTNACTCGKDVCAAGQSCDSNTTCKADNTPAPTGESAAGYEKPAIAFLTVVAIAFSALY